MVRKWYFEPTAPVEDTPVVLGATFYMVQMDEEGSFIDLDKPYTKSVVAPLSDFLPEVDE